jgi:cysteinyl-tRNA synthetase
MLKLYETRSREVLPIEGTDGALKVYCCGPTVYRDAHVGNLRTFLLSDLISRAAALSGLNVTLIQNITDVGHMVNDLEDTPSTNLEWLIDQTEKFCQDKAIYNAIMKSIQIIDTDKDNHSKGCSY